MDTLTRMEDANTKRHVISLSQRILGIAYHGRMTDINVYVYNDFIKYYLFPIQY